MNKAQVTVIETAAHWPGSPPEGSLNILRRADLLLFEEGVSDSWLEATRAETRRVKLLSQSGSTSRGAEEWAELAHGYARQVGHVVWLHSRAIRSYPDPVRLLQRANRLDFEVQVLELGQSIPADNLVNQLVNTVRPEEVPLLLAYLSLVRGRLQQTQPGTVMLGRELAASALSPEHLN